MNLAPIPGEEHLEKVCKPGRSSLTCAYLGFIHGWVCLKSDPSYKATIDARRESMNAAGDNCSGPDKWERK